LCGERVARRGGAICSARERPGEELGWPSVVLEFAEISWFGRLVQQRAAMIRLRWN
jgi:hypothetical protein